MCVGVGGVGEWAGVADLGRGEGVLIKEKKAKSRLILFKKSL